MIYRIKGYTFDQVTRLAFRLCLKTKVDRLAWVGADGVAVIVPEGPGGYRHEPVPNPGPNDCKTTLVCPMLPADAREVVECNIL
jgi:hypothetical protein